MHSICRLLPAHTLCKITQRNHMRRENTYSPALKLLNEKINLFDLHTHKQNLWKGHLDAHWDYRHNTHILWKTIHSLSNRAPPPTINVSITLSNKTANTSRIVSPNNSQTLSSKQQTRQTDTLTEQHKNTRT